ncbi:MAG: hypothetical protein AAF652_20030 [Cyanobacteria bacterium P01_C01_bin.72]
MAKTSAYSKRSKCEVAFAPDSNKELHPAISDLAIDYKLLTKRDRASNKIGDSKLRNSNNRNFHQNIGDRILIGKASFKANRLEVLWFGLGNVSE